MGRDDTEESRDLSNCGALVSGKPQDEWRELTKREGKGLKLEERDCQRGKTTEAPSGRTE